MVQVTHDDVVINVTNVFGKDYTAARELFLGIVIALVSVETYTFLQTPLEKVIQGLLGLLILMLATQLFWTIGIHGNQIIKPVRDSLLNTAILANMDLVAQGITDVFRLNIINMSF